MSAPPPGLTGATLRRAAYEAAIRAMRRSHEESVRSHARVNIGNNAHVDLVATYHSVSPDHTETYIYIPRGDVPTIVWNSLDKLDTLVIAWVGGGQMIVFKPDVDVRFTTGTVTLTHDGSCPNTRAFANFAHDATVGTLKLKSLSVEWR
jgi:hypothetical protein